jgi:hypothetical protein
VKAKGNRERIPKAMAPWQRVVASMPLDRLFTEAGFTAHVRGEALAPALVEALLHSSHNYALVEARIGAPLRWYDSGDYGFWYHCVRHHAAEPDNQRSLDEFPDSRCYFVSLWRDSGRGDQVLLCEEHH